MADELNTTLLIDFAKDTFAILKDIRGLAINVGAGPYHHTNQLVTTSELALSIGGLTTGGYCFLKNHDVTNSVSIKSATGVVPLISLLPLDIAWFRLSPSSTAPFVNSTTASVRLEILLFSV